MRHTIYTFLSIFLLLLCSNVLFAQTSRPLVTQKSELPCLNKTFNVVVHVVENEEGDIGVSLDSIADKIAKVNELFAPICVGFTICEVKTIENYQYDSVKVFEWEELQVTYHQANKINIFWVSQFDFEKELCGVTELGDITNLESGGILMMKGECVNEFAIAHELGRFFGLPYTFGDGEERTTELVKGGECATGGDLICDTPADPYILEDEPEEYVDPSNCRFINQDRDDEGEWYVAHTGNIMSYYADECKCEFSQDQYRLMVATYLSVRPRMW